MDSRKRDGLRGARKQALSAGERHGRALAIQMLEEASRGGADERCSIDEKFRAGKPQDLVTQRYFDTLQAVRDPDVMIGFHQVLSDFLAMAANGDMVMSPDFYRATLTVKKSRRHTVPAGSATAGDQGA